MAETVDPAWIDAYPPPLPNRKPADAELLALRDTVGHRVSFEFELYSQWNARWATVWGCVPDGPLRGRPAPMFVFDPPEPNVYPTYRYLQGVTTPLGLVTNRFGWRGPELPLNKPAGTIRIAFVGASTTVAPHDFPFSYPEYVIHWLNLWAKRRGDPVRFDGINAGRTGIGSRDIAAVVRQELLPAEPDLVVYYEGANQFGFSELLDAAVPPMPVVPEGGAGSWSGFARSLRHYLSLFRRIERVRQVIAVGDGSEPPKPPYRLVWPAGLDEFEPNIAHPDLPLQLSTILADLESIRRSLASIGSELAVSSFVWLVHDGMRLNPARHAPIHADLNHRWWPYRYADLRRMADLQNRVFSRYAAARNLLFIDLAATVPADPDLFSDPIHFTQEGIRMQAWGVLNAILPRVRERLGSGSWPRADRVFIRRHPGISAPRRISGCPDAAPD